MNKIVQCVRVKASSLSAGFVRVALVACAVFAFDACADEIRYTGTSGGSWDVAANWSLGRVPQAEDDVLINGRMVKASASIVAKSIVVKGKNGMLAIAGASWTADAQTAVAGLQGEVLLSVFGDVIIDGGSFSLGARDADYGFSAEIAGNLIVTNGAIAAFYAGPASGVQADNAVLTSALLFAQANVISVSGDFCVSDGSTVFHENHALTGTPVLFKVGNFYQQQGALNSAAGRGWGSRSFPFNPPAGAVYIGASGYSYAYSYALGTGAHLRDGARTGGGYGGAGGNAGVEKVSFVCADGSRESREFYLGGTYGLATAAFLPGSPNGVFLGGVRGGGSVLIWASGCTEVRGTISACGEDYSKGASSGGSIWLAASRLTVAEVAELTAEGGTAVSDSDPNAGGGGRVTLTVGLTEGERAALVRGETPVSMDLKVMDIFGCACNVQGGLKNAGQDGRAPSGTAKLVYKTGRLPFAVAIEAREDQSSIIACGATPDYGLHVCPTADVPVAFEPNATVAIHSHFRGFRRNVWWGVEARTSEGPIPVHEVCRSDDPVWVSHAWSPTEDCLRLRIVGSGAVIANGQEYDADADIWLEAGTRVDVMARVGAERFVAWMGDFTNGVSSSSSLMQPVWPGMTIWAVFADSQGVDKSYVGVKGGLWDEPSNWLPAGVPTPIDRVTITGKTVRSYGMAAASSIALEDASLMVGGGGSVLDQTPPADCFMGDCGLLVQGDFCASGASAFSLGARLSSAPIFAAKVGGSVTLKDTAQFAVYATPYMGELDAGGKIPLFGYYHSALPFAIGGKLTLQDMAALYPENDIVTGNPVRFEVSGDVIIGASAQISSSVRGWGWISSSDTGGVDSRSRSTSAGSYTLAPGYGSSYTYGGVYGGGNDSPPQMRYGFPYAPLLSGSPGGMTSTARRAGGTVWLKTPGTIEINGRILSQGGYGNGRQDSAASGGGIWLVAQKVISGTGASVNANGAEWGYAETSSGGGGRISVALGVSDEELEQLATGMCPASLTYEDSIPVAPATAQGGRSKRSVTTGLFYTAPHGTCTTVAGILAEYPLEITAQPVLCCTEGLTYETVYVPTGQVWRLTAGEYGYDPQDPKRVRYACEGWVISNATGQVAAGQGTTASFVPDRGPFHLIWKWTDRQTRAQIAVNDERLGAVRLNGASASSSVDEWVSADGLVVCEAVPKGDGEFLFWAGDVPYGQCTNRVLTVSASSPVTLKPFFRLKEPRCTRTWVGAAQKRGEWTDVANWQPSNLPGCDDDVIVGRGVCDVTNCLSVGSLTVSGEGVVRVAVKDRVVNAIIFGPDKTWTAPYDGKKTRLAEAFVRVGRDLLLRDKSQLVVNASQSTYHATVVVGGDFLLAETNLFVVAAGPMEEGFSFASGAGHVSVGGRFAVLGSSCVVPYCESYTGGTVVFRARAFELGEDASFFAENSGFAFYADRNPTTHAPGVGGNEHRIGGGYGGFGKSYSQTLGRTYGFAYAPVHPGSPQGEYSHEGSGGLVRIHAGRARIAGRLDANAYDYSGTSASGGGIWVTTRRQLELVDGSVLTARGGAPSYSNNFGGGGRIALAQYVSDAQVDEFAQTGSVSGWTDFARRDRTESFAAEHPGVTIDVRAGADSGDAYNGTFRFVDGRLPPMCVIIR